MSDTKNHPFQIVDPSPWPITTAMSSLLITLGAVLSMRLRHHIVLIVGFLMLFGCLFGWWRDVVKESKDQTIYTAKVKQGLQIGMLIFIFTEIMFFVSFFWAFFEASLDPKAAIGSVWPPKGIKTLDPFDLPYLNTLILLLSGTTLTWAHHALLNDRQKEFSQALGITILLGLIFTSIQAYEYAHAPFLFKGGIYPSTFYMATGFHGFHVIVGTLFLATCYWRSKTKGDITKESHTGFEMAAWYWHFVDVVWLFLFVSIYWWGSAS